jgi:hypothetical membrane protein
MKRTLLNRLGLLGAVGFVSYVAAVIAAQAAYPGYEWMKMAVSDLMAESAPSRMIYNAVSSPAMPCLTVCAVLCSIEAERRFSRGMRAGIHLYTLMIWVTATGYAAFPLGEEWQNMMHIVVTAAVVVLSVLSLAVITAAGLLKKKQRFLGLSAAVCLLFMLTGAVGVNAAEASLFGLFERFSTFSALGFDAVLGLYLYAGSPKEGKESE